jgi:hypothetical protein
MTDELSDKQIDELKEAFGLYEESGGVIKVKDLPALLKAIGHNPSEEETKNLIAQVSGVTRVGRGPFLTSPLGANFDPQGLSCPPGVNLYPRGEDIPWG